MRKIKGKINKNGVLEIERSGRFKKQDCLRSAAWINDNLGCSFCGDNCSLFGEPGIEKFFTGRIFLKLCEKTWYFDEFEDER